MSTTATTTRSLGVRSVSVRRLLDASPERVFRAWSSPEELAAWFPHRVEGSLAPGTRSTLVWPDQRIWWEVLEAEPDRRFRFRWPWLADDSIVSEVLVEIEPRGYGSTLRLTDGPFDVDRPGGLDAYAECLEGWGEALTLLRAQLDFSVDLRHIP